MKHKIIEVEPIANGFLVTENQSEGSPRKAYFTKLKGAVDFASSLLNRSIEMDDRAFTNYARHFEKTSRAAANKPDTST